MYIFLHEKHIHEDTSIRQEKWARNTKDLIKNENGITLYDFNSLCKIEKKQSVRLNYKNNHIWLNAQVNSCTKMCTVHLDYGNLECLYQSAEWNTQIYIENESNTLYNIYILYNIISTALKRSLIVLTICLFFN